MAQQLKVVLKSLALVWMALAELKGQDDMVGCPPQADPAPLAKLKREDPRLGVGILLVGLDRGNNLG